MPELRLKPSSETDIHKIVRIYQDEISASWKYEDFEKKRLETNHRMYSVFFGNNCIGFLIFQIILPEADLLNIAIDKEYQSKGYGARVLKNAIDLMKRSGVQKIFLEVRATSPAVRFYENNGFKKIDIRKNYYEKSEDALIMNYLI